MEFDQNKTFNLADNWKAVGFLMANYQGRFAALNILGQLTSVDFKKTELEETKSLLKDLVDMVNTIKNGNAIFFPTPEEEEDQEPAQLKARQELLLKIVSQLKMDLIDRAEKTKQFLSAPSKPNQLREAQYLLSSYGWYAYARDNYSRSMLEIADFIRDPLTKETFEELKRECAEEIKLTNDFLKAIKKLETARHNILDHVWFFCRTLPGIFRANCHDLNLLLSFRSAKFTYADAGFLVEEEDAWQTAGFDPESAGYWNAFGFSPNQALLWMQVGLNDPKLAAEWATAGFTAEVSIAWIAVQFNPLLAIQWYNAGYQPDQAAFLVGKGFHHPVQVRPEQLPELVKEFESLKISTVKSEEEAWFGTDDSSEDDGSER